MSERKAKRCINDRGGNSSDRSYSWAFIYGVPSCSLYTSIDYGQYRIVAIMSSSPLLLAPLFLVLSLQALLLQALLPLR